jgi:Cu-Zn family superoxide dismutase
MAESGQPSKGEGMKLLRTLAVVGAAAIVAAALATGGAVAKEPRGLVANLQDATGDAIGTVRFVPTDDGKVSVRVTASGLTPGFHGFHVHTTGTCDPLAKDAAGNTVPFVTAGGHYNPDATATHSSHAGDMPPMLITTDGTAQLRFKTDRFPTADLMDADGSAVIVHAGPDNLGNVPGTTSTGGERYHSHVDMVFGPDTATKATGDAGARFGCGVIQKSSS